MAKPIEALFSPSAQEEIDYNANYFGDAEQEIPYLKPTPDVDEPEEPFDPSFGITLTKRGR